MTDREELLLDLASAQGLQQALFTTDGQLLVATRPFATVFGKATGDIEGKPVAALGLPAQLAGQLTASLAAAGDGQARSIAHPVAGTGTFHLKPQADGTTVLVSLRHGSGAVGGGGFLSTAVHDLRQPFQAMHLFHHLLESRVVEPDLKELVGRLGEAITGGEGLLSSIFDVMLLDAGAITSRAEETALDDILADLLEDFADEADARGLRLNVRPTEAVVRVDGVLLQRLLRTLLSNAVRFTARGGVFIGARRRGDRLRIEVWDTGPGIDPAQQQVIFEDFKQLDQGARSGGQQKAQGPKNLGAGLGLSIARRLAGLMELPLGLRSHKGRGSVFYVEVPLVRPLLDDPHGDDGVDEPDRSSSNQGTVLVIEDDDIQLQGIDLLLTGWGYRVIPTRSLAEAYDNLSRRGELAPDLVLSDLRLAGSETGVEAIGAIRRHFGRPLPGVIITGDTDPARLRMADRSGYSVLHKPCQPSQLRATLVDVMGR